MADTEYMRELARKGGAATKAKAAADPTYYSRLGQLGGKKGAGKKRGPYKGKRARPAEAPPAAPVDDIAKRQPRLDSPKSALDVLEAIIGGA